MTTTWNPSDESAGTTLSSGNLVATMSTSSDGARSTTSQTTGKIAFSVTGNWLAGSLCGGISKSGADYAGGDANGYVLAYISGYGWAVVNSGGLAQGPDSTSPAPTSSSIVLVCLDSAGKLYFQCDGNNLFGANPAAGTGGLTVGTGTWFADIGSCGFFATGTANFSPTGLPSGFSAWDAAAGPVDITATMAATVPAPAVAIAATETPVWSLVGVSEAAINASGNYTLTEPAGTQQDDILVVDFAARSTVIYTNASFTFPQSDSGGNTTNGSTASDTSFQTGYCIRGASAPTLTFSRTGGSRALGTMRAYRSSRAGTPSFDTSAKFAQTSAGTGITLSGGITTAQDDELLVTGVYLARGATSNNASNMDAVSGLTGGSGTLSTTTPPTIGTWVERSDRGDTTSPTVGLACYDGVMGSAGSTGNLTATAASSALNAMTVMAFQHPSSGGGTTNQSVTVTATTSTALVKGTGKKVAATCAGAVILTRAVAKKITATCVSVISPSKAVVKAIAAACVTSTAISASRAFLQAILVTCTSTTGLVKTVSKSIAATLSGGVAVTSAKTFTKMIAVTASASVAAMRTVAKRISVTSSGSVTAVRAVTKSISVAAVTTAAVVASRAILQAVVVTCSSAVGLTRSVVKRIVTTASGMVSAIKRINLTIALSGATSTAADATRAFLVGITVACGSAVSLSRSVGKRVTAGCASAVGMVRGVALAVKATAITAATAVKGTNLTIVASVSSTATVNAIRAFLVAIAATCGSAVAISHSVGKRIAASVTGHVTVVRRVAVTLATTCASVATALAAKGAEVFQVAFDAAVSTSAAMGRSVGKRVTANIGGTITTGRGIAKRVAVTVDGTVAATKAISKNVAVAVSYLVDLLTSIFRPNSRITSMPVSVRTGSLAASVGTGSAALAVASGTLPASVNAGTLPGVVTNGSVNVTLSTGSVPITVEV